MAQKQKSKVKSKVTSKVAKVSAQARSSKNASAGKKAMSAKPTPVKAPAKVAAKAAAKIVRAGSAKAQPKAAIAKSHGHTSKAVKPAAAHKPVAAKAPVKAVPASKAAAHVSKPAAGKAAPAKAAAARSSTIAGIAKAHAAQLAKNQQPQRAVTAAVAKLPGQKISAPAPTAGHMPGAAAVGSPKGIAEKAAAARVMLAANKKPVSTRHGFKTNQFVVLSLIHI